MLIGFIYSQPIQIFAQSSDYVKDTAYIFLWRGTLENERPITTYVVNKTMSNLTGLSLIKNRDSFVCSFFKKAILFDEPYFTLEKNIGLYGFSNKESASKFLSDISEKVEKLNKEIVKIGTKKFEQGTSIEFECVRVIADFWVINKTSDELNNYTHSFYVPGCCYNKKYIYNLKNIDRIERLNSTEILQLKNYLGL